MRGKKPVKEDLMQQAKSAYPYLRDKKFGFVSTPNEQDRRSLEFYAAGEPGSPEEPRPKELPLDMPGVQVFKSKVKPIDILGDYVSHHAVKSDPVIKPIYDEFVRTIDPNLLQHRYEYDVKHSGEKRPLQQWAEASGIPSMFRGYTFGQWPSDFNDKIFTPQQKAIMDKAKKVLGVK